MIILLLRSIADSKKHLLEEKKKAPKCTEDTLVFQTQQQSTGDYYNIRFEIIIISFLSSGYQKKTSDPHSKL